MRFSTIALIACIISTVQCCLDCTSVNYFYTVTHFLSRLFILRMAEALNRKRAKLKPEQGVAYRRYFKPEIDMHWAFTIYYRTLYRTASEFRKMFLITSITELFTDQVF